MNKIGIIFASISVVVVSGGTIQRRSVEINPPCFMDDSGSPDEVETLLKSIQKVNDQIFTFVVRSDQLRATMEFGPYGNGTDSYFIEVPKGQREKASFMNLSRIDATLERPIFESQFCNDSVSFSEKLREHFDLLNQLAYYFEQLLKTVKDDTARNRLVNIQGTIYDCMCTLKTALRSQNQDPILPSGNVAEDFIKYRSGIISTAVQQTSEFIIVLDSQRTASYLEHMYSSFKGTSSPTCM